MVLVGILALVTVAIRLVLTAVPGAAWASPTLTPVGSVSAQVLSSATPTAALSSSPEPVPTFAAPPETSTPTLTLTPSATPHPPDELPGPPVIVTDTSFVTETATPLPLPIPSPMPLVEQSEDTINILLLGSDRADGVGLTDVIVVVSIDPELPSVSLLSIPRDFYAWIPTQGFNKINTAYNRGIRENYPGGGAELLKATIEYNLGIRIHYYALVGFDGFIKVVDALGGVDVAVECALSDTFPDADSPTGQTDVDWLPGIHHLDGKHALWYIRSRWNTHDFDRNRRQQQVLRGLYHQIVTQNMIPRIPELWGVLNETVVTDLGLDELLYLASIGPGLDMANVRSNLVGGEALQVWTAPNGAYVLVPYYDALSEMVREALMPPASGREQQSAFRVEVWNASPEDGLGYVAVERLRWEGLEVTSVTRVGGDYPRTQIWDFTTTSKGSPVAHLMRLYGRYAGDLVSQPTEDRQVDFRVILGQDYDPCWATRIRWTSEDLPTPTPLPTVTPTASP